MTPHSGHLKEMALYWLRFDKQVSYLCTEYGQYNADVFGATELKSYEIETKVSISDLRADFSKHKHTRYRDVLAELTPGGGDRPQYFYFMVPHGMAAMTRQICEEKGAHQYGVISVDPWADTAASRMHFVKKATRLHTVPPSARVLRNVAHRMASEIIGLRTVNNRLSQLHTEVIDQVKETWKMAYGPESEDG